jgi:kynurenine formamidase
MRFLFIFIILILTDNIVSKELTERDKFNNLSKEISNWGRWGPNDQLGTLNNISDKNIIEAKKLIIEGKTISLSRNMGKKITPFNSAPIKHQPFIIPSGAFGQDPEHSHEGAGDTFEINYHGFSHTHIDAINHFARDGKMYNGYTFEIGSNNEFENLGIEEVGKLGIVSRGVLIDLPVFFDVDYIKSGTAIKIEDIKKWEKKNNIKIGKGDILLLRTGRWEELRQKGYWDFSKKATGFHYSVATFFKERDIAVIGCDGVNDVMPSGIESKFNALHELAIVDLGMPIIDNMDLDLLSKKLEKLNRKTFLFIANPLRIKGATGTPINPIAIY